uniref:Uncharacterized protein n=1 Tax=viral metagenome TaxID=1070528 RepID=A0A6M3IMW5_9ZZZZ
MIKTARLTIKYQEGSDMKAVLQSAMEAAGVSMADIEMKGKDYSSNTHFGNWVLTPVLDNEASKKVADIMGTELDFQDAILEESDIYKFKIGQKVRVRFMTELAFRVDQEGTVNNINYTGGEVSILKKRARKMGWRFRVGDRVIIEAI